MAIRYQTFFSVEGRHLSPLNFRWVHLSVFIIFSCLDLCCILVRICVWFLYEQVITRYLRTNFGFKLLGTLKKRYLKKRGQHLATKRGFLGKFLLELEWWYKVQ